MRINRVVLAAEMARREWTGKRLSEVSGVSRVTLSAVRGGKAIAPKTAEKIAGALGVPVDQLVEVNSDS